MESAQGELSTNLCAVKTLWALSAIFLAAALVIWWRPLFRRGQADGRLEARFFGFAGIAAFVFIPAYLGGLAFAVCIGAIVLVCLTEYFSILGLEGMHKYKRLALFLSVLLIAAAAFARGSPGLSEGAEPVLSCFFYLMPAVVIATVSAVPLFTGSYERTLTMGALTIFGVMYFGWFLAHLVLIRNMPNGFGYFVFLAMCVAMNDIFAFTVGKSMGRKKLSAIISPGKTWEGLAGGMLGSILAACIFAYCVADIGLSNLIVMTLLISIIAPIGDLIVSAIKRDMNVKDCGTLMPGHGGLLDRCDSAILVSPVIYYYLTFFARA